MFVFIQVFVNISSSDHDDDHDTTDKTFYVLTFFLLHTDMSSMTLNDNVKKTYS